MSGRHKLCDLKHGDYTPILNNWHSDDKVEYEIIGNIHETQELL